MSEILIVDDSQIDLQRASLLLKKQIEGVEILTARDGFEALEILETHRPNLVITDLQMPRMNGLELVMEMQEKHPLIPVVLLTAAGSEKIATEALLAGAASYVPKTQLAVDLAHVVSRLLGMAREKRNQFKILSSITEVSFELENDRNLIVDFVHEFREVLQNRKLFTENDCFRVTMAVDEALSNAYYHGNLEVSSELREQDAFSFDNLAAERSLKQPYADRKIYITISLRDDLVVTIRDEGPGFNIEKLPCPFDPGFVERPCGRGVLLMKSFMDSISYNDGGNQVTMTKKRHRSTPRG